MLDVVDAPLQTDRKLVKVDDFVALTSRNTSLNSSRSYYSVFSNSRTHLANSQLTPNDQFLKHLDQRFRKLKNYVSKLKSPKDSPARAKLWESIRKSSSRKSSRKMARGDSIPNIKLSNRSLVTADKFAPNQFKTITPILKNVSAKVSEWWQDILSFI